MIRAYPEIGLCNVSEVALDSEVCGWYIVDGVEVLLLGEPLDVFPSEHKAIKPSHCVCSVFQPQEGSKEEIRRFVSEGMQKDDLRLSRRKERTLGCGSGNAL